MIRWSALLLSAAAGLTTAHDSRPIYVQVDEADSGLVSVRWNVPLQAPAARLPAPVLPAGCEARDQAVYQRTDGGTLGRRDFVCREALSGREVGMHFVTPNPSLSMLFQVQLRNGEQHLQVLSPGTDLWRVPDAEAPLAVAGEYTLLGMEHIWIGADHLLFVALLVFVARSLKRLLLTITGFTVAHSITLALAALELVRVPTAPVEAAIALSVVLLAVEVARADASSLTFRYPVLVSSSFGLLHGFGFASVLADIGLPQTALPTALLFFNVGVEVGQILFVLVLLVGWWALAGRRQGAGQSDRFGLPTLATVVVYAIGGIASYWVIERITQFWS